MPTGIHGAAIQLVDGYLEYFDPSQNQWFPIGRHYSLHTPGRVALAAQLTVADGGKVSCWDIDDEYTYWWSGTKWL